MKGMVVCVVVVVVVVVFFFLSTEKSERDIGTQHELKNGGGKKCFYEVLGQ
jgi:hypothetical protein